MRIPARPGLGQNGHAGGPENRDSPAAEQAASCNDAASHAESDCVTPHNPQKVSCHMQNMSHLGPGFLANWKAVLQHYDVPESQKKIRCCT